MKSRAASNQFHEPIVVSATTALATDEDRWYQHQSDSLLATAIHQWLVQRTVARSNSGNPLADEEDAWARS